MKDPKYDPLIVDEIDAVASLSLGLYRTRGGQMAVVATHYSTPAGDIRWTGHIKGLGLGVWDDQGRDLGHKPLGEPAPFDLIERIEE